MHCPLIAAAALLAGALAGCSPTAPGDSDPRTAPVPKPLTASLSLSTYFPPAEAAGGWRAIHTATEALALGLDSAKLRDLGDYVMSVPSEHYNTGVSGYLETNKAVLVVKSGWLAGEYYNQETARTGVYYLASNGKTFAMMLMGRLRADYPALGVTLDSRLYDSLWLRQGYPLSDPRKADITLDQVFRHRSGIIPQVEASIADGAVPGGAGWNFVPFTVGQDADWPVSGPLYFTPGDPSTYTKGSTYSSVAFNHVSLFFRNVTGLEPSAYLRSAILGPIGVGRMAYKRRAGVGDYQWATAGNGLASARDFVRLGYLLLHEGDWAGRSIVPADWLRQFTSTTGYPNLLSNRDCSWGPAYPADMYLTTGSGINRMVIVPSLDLVATINGRLKWSKNAEVTRNYLVKLFAAVRDQYVTCDGRVVNEPQAMQVSGITLMNADTDQPIGPLLDGMTLDLSALPTRNLNVRADPAGPVASIRFALDANGNYRTETIAPYSLAGDTDGNYAPWTPSPGVHTLTATPYSGPGATGPVGTPIRATFTVR
jgi:CubicO group peptidase (beta-lactamase class C family)